MLHRATTTDRAGMQVLVRVSDPAEMARTEHEALVAETGHHEALETTTGAAMDVPTGDACSATARADDRRLANYGRVCAKERSTASDIGVRRKVAGQLLQAASTSFTRRTALLASSA